MTLAFVLLGQRDVRPGFAGELFAGALYCGLIALAGCGETGSSLIPSGDLHGKILTLSPSGKAARPTDQSGASPFVLTAREAGYHRNVLGADYLRNVLGCPTTAIGPIALIVKPSGPPCRASDTEQILVSDAARAVLASTIGSGEPDS